MAHCIMPGVGVASWVGRLQILDAPEAQAMRMELINSLVLGQDTVEASFLSSAFLEGNRHSQKFAPNILCIKENLSFFKPFVTKTGEEVGIHHNCHTSPF